MTDMGISPISEIASNYNILSVYGNPNSVNKISEVQSDTQANQPLIVATESDTSKNQAVTAEPTTSTASGGFADLLKMQEEIFGDDESVLEQASSTDNGLDYQGMMEQMMSNASVNFQSLATA